MNVMTPELYQAAFYFINVFKKINDIVHIFKAIVYYSIHYI